MAASNPDPISIATEKSILPPSFGKQPEIVTVKNDSSSDELAVKTEDGEDLIKESDYTPEEYKQLVRKIDRYLLPLMVRPIKYHMLDYNIAHRMPSGSATASSKPTRPPSAPRRSLASARTPASLDSNTPG